MEESIFDLAPHKSSAMLDLAAIVPALYRDATMSNEINSSIARAAQIKAGSHTMRELASQMEAYARAKQDIFLKIARMQLLGVCLYQFQNVLDDFLEEKHINAAIQLIPSSMLLLGSLDETSIDAKNEDLVAMSSFLIETTQAASWFIDHITQSAANNTSHEHTHDPQEPAGPFLGLVIMLLVWRYNENGGPVIAPDATASTFDITELDPKN